ASVAIENINAHLSAGKTAPVAVRDAMREVQTPRLVAMLCICAVFIPSFYMAGVGRALFGALALAVGLAIIALYLMTSTLVAILGAWILRPKAHHDRSSEWRILRSMGSMQEKVVATLIRRARTT